MVVHDANPEVIADATLYLLHNPDLSKQIGRNARQSILEQYSIERQMNQYHSLYESVFESTYTT